MLSSTSTTQKTNNRLITMGHFAASVLIFHLSFGLSSASTVAKNKGTQHYTFGNLLCRQQAEDSTYSNLPPKVGVIDLDASGWFVNQREIDIRVNNIPLKIEKYGDSQIRPRPSQKKLESEEEEKAAKSSPDPSTLKSVTQPFVLKSDWSRLQGNEYDQPGVIDNLVQTAVSMTKPEDSDWISWAPQSHKQDEKSPANAVRVYVGKCRKSNSDEYYGANLPVIKTEASLRIAPKDMADLLLDSSRVKVYNKMSIGRSDIRNIKCDKGVAKIVKNVTKPPMTKKNIESVTLMHSRQLDETGTYIVVSRAAIIPERTTCNEGDDEDCGKSEILLGVNLLEPIDEDNALGSRMTSITHVYSPALPVLVAKRVGVNSAINFVNDIRSVCKDKTS